MDRLVKPDLKEIELVFKSGEKCTKSFRLSNLMHTMPVAISLSTSNPSIFTFNQTLSIIPPLSSVTYNLISLPCDEPTISSSSDYISVRSSMLPIGKAHENDLRRLFSRPGTHVFKDATIPISFVGFQVIKFLIPRSTEFAEIHPLVAKSIPWCDKSQLTSLLRSAILCGDAKIVPSLIDSGADVNYRDTDGKTLISVAIRSGNVEILKALSVFGGEVNDEVDLAMHEAANFNRVDLMEALLRGFQGVDLNRVNSCGRTPIHVAAAKGSIEAIRFCLSKGGNPNAVDVHGWTPLHCAAEKGHLSAVEFLLDCHRFHGRAVVDKDGRTAFGVAVENGHKHLYDALQLGDELQRAARVGDVSTVKSCLSQGAKVNRKDQNGWTPLHRAAFKGRIECVRLLLSHGGDVDCVDASGYTPLHCAVEAGHVQVAMALVTHGAKASVKGLNIKSCVALNLELFKDHLHSTNE